MEAVSTTTFARLIFINPAEVKLSHHIFMQGNGKISRSSIAFPPAARRMDTLNDLLSASDVISLHCALSDETVQIINADCLQHIKPGNQAI